MEISDYEKQAQDFLDKTGTVLTFKFLGYRSHFLDDKEKRLQWEYTLTRGSRKYTANFGESLATTYEKIMGEKYPYRKPMTLYNEERMFDRVRTIKITPEGKATFFAGRAKKEIPPPGAYDILAGLGHECPTDLDEFASEYGFTSIKRAIIAHKACLEEYQGLCSLYNDEEMRELQEIS